MGESGVFGIRRSVDSRDLKAWPGLRGDARSAEDIGVGDGIALFLSGALTQLRLPWSSPLVIQLLLRSSDGRFWIGELSSASFPLAEPPSFHRWDPATLPRHFWSVAELTPNRLCGSSQLTAQASLLRLGVVQGYAVALKIRLSLLPTSPECEPLQRA